MLVTNHTVFEARHGITRKIHFIMQHQEKAENDKLRKKHWIGRHSSALRTWSLCINSHYSRQIYYSIFCPNKFFRSIRHNITDFYDMISQCRYWWDLHIRSHRLSYRIVKNLQFQYQDHCHKSTKDETNHNSIGYYYRRILYVYPKLYQTLTKPQRVTSNVAHHMTGTELPELSNARVDHRTAAWRLPCSWSQKEQPWLASNY